MAEINPMPRDARNTTETTAPRPPGDTGAAVPIPGSPGAIPRPDAATCEVLRSWTVGKLSEAGVRNAAPVAFHLGVLAGDKAERHPQKAEVDASIIMLRDHRLSPGIASLIESLNGLLPQPQSAAAPVKGTRPVQPDRSTSSQAAVTAVAGEMVAATPTIPIDETVVVLPTEASPTNPSCTTQGAEVTAGLGQAPAKVKVVPIESLVTDAGTQMRESLDSETAAEYAAAMTGGAEFPPVVVFHDGSRCYLADGFHRTMAAVSLGHNEIAADVRVGTVKDALWYAIGANSRNGMRLNKLDLAHAISQALREFSDKSNGLIAKHVGCSESYVRRISSELRTSAMLPPPPERTVGKDGKSRPATRKSKAKAPGAGSIAMQDGASPAGSALGVQQAPATGLAPAQVAVPTAAIAADQQRWVDQLWRVASAKPREEWPAIAEAMRVVIGRLEGGAQALPPPTAAGREA